jgi:hypothetical protein
MNDLLMRRSHWSFSVRKGLGLWIQRFHGNKGPTGMDGLTDCLLALLENEEHTGIGLGWA